MLASLLGAQIVSLPSSQAEVGDVYLPETLANSWGRESTSGASIVTGQTVTLPFPFRFYQDAPGYDPVVTTITPTAHGLLFIDGTPQSSCYQGVGNLDATRAIAAKWLSCGGDNLLNPYEVTYSIGPGSSFVRFRWERAGETLDALLFTDGRIRIDFGAQTRADHGHITGISRGNVVQKHYWTNDTTTDVAWSHMWTPKYNPVGLSINLARPEAGSIYIDGVKSATTITGARNAYSAGAVPLRATSSGGVGSVNVSIFVGTQLAAWGTNGIAEGTWTPPSSDFAMYTIRAIATSATGRVETSREVFASSQAIPVGQLLTPVVALISPNGDEWVDGTGYFAAEAAVISACPTYTPSIQFSKDGGRTFTTFKTYSAAGPVNARWYMDILQSALTAFDSGEAKMRLSIAVPACGGNPARVVSDASDREFTIDLNGLAARLTPTPPAGSVVNGFYTQPLGFDITGASAGGFARISAIRDGAAPSLATAYIDEMSALGDSGTGTHWRWTQTPLAPLPMEIRSAEWAYPGTPLWLPRQGPNAVAFSYQVPWTGATTSTAVATRMLPVSTSAAGMDTVELWAYFETNAELQGDLVVRLRSGAVDEAVISGTIITGTWTRLSTSAPAATIDNVQAEFRGSNAGADGPSVVFQEFVLDGLRAVKNVQENADGTHQWAAQAISGASTETTASEPIALDLLAPTGSVSINNGAAITNSIVVSLELAATDTVSGVREMMISNGPEFTGSVWEAYSTQKTWTLSPLAPGQTEATRSVYAKFRDGVARVSQQTDDDILVDPTTPTFSANYAPGEQWLGTATHTLSISVSDNVAINAGSAQAGFGSTLAAISFQGATYSGTITSGSISRSVTAPEGRSYAGFKIRDTAGNEATLTKQLNVDLTGPTAGIDIVQSSTNTRTVQLVLTSQDTLSGVAEYRVGNAPGAGSWAPVAATAQASVEIELDWTLLDQDGRRYVYVQFRDAVGHASPERSDSVILDRRGPIITPVSPTPGSTNVPTTGTTIRADWHDDTSISNDVVGVNPLTGRMQLRDMTIGLPPVDVTAQTQRTATSITYQPLALNPCTQYEVIVSVNDNLNNPSSETRWIFVTGCV